MKVAVIMGSDSDLPVLRPAIELLHEFGVQTDATVASAHRTPTKVREIVTSARGNGIGAFICAAGAAAHLGGVIASYTTLPVIGIPVNATALNGMDALLSTVQMPSGIPVATMAINGAKNAAIFALEIFAVTDSSIQKKLADYRQKMVKEVDEKARKVEAELN